MKKLHGNSKYFLLALTTCISTFIPKVINAQVPMPILVEINQKENLFIIMSDDGNRTEFARFPVAVGKSLDLQPEGEFKIDKVARRAIFNNWGDPAPEVGCPAWLKSLSKKPTKNNLNIVVHTEPHSVREKHPTIDACKEGISDEEVAKLIQKDTFKVGKRSNGCFRLSVFNARYFFYLALNHPMRIVVTK